jgi:hypothetical protein
MVPETEFNAKYHFESKIKMSKLKDFESDDFRDLESTVKRVVKTKSEWPALLVERLLDSFPGKRGREIIFPKLGEIAKLGSEQVFLDYQKWKKEYKKIEHSPVSSTSVQQTAHQDSSAKIAVVQVMNNVQKADKRYWPIILNSFVNRQRHIEFKK